MKRINILIIAILIVLPYSQLQAINHTIEFSEKDFTFREENGFTIVEHPDCGYYGEVGAPQVLATGYNFIIPIDQTVQSIEITEAVSEQFDGEFDLFPVQEDDYYQTCCPDEPSEWVDPDPEYYESSEPYPEIPVELAYTGLFDGANHIAKVIVYPIFYIASEKSLHYYSSIDFTLKIGGSPDKEPKFVNIRMRTDQAVYDKILYDMVENPEDIPLYGYRPPLSDTSFVENNRDYPVYPFLIVTRESLRDYWDPYLEWLNRKGKRAGLLTMEMIVEYGIIDDPEVDDHANFLRGYLDYAHQNGTVWVILGGTSEAEVQSSIYEDEFTIPARYTLYENYVGEVNCLYRHDFIPSDIYYSEYDTDWEVDGDGYPGEKWHDLNRQIDYEDLFLGRVPVTIPQDLIDWIQNIFNYEQNPGNGDNAYLLNAYWTLADQMSDDRQEEEGIPYFPSFSHLVQHEIPSGIDPHPTAPTGDLVIQQMSEMPGFINWYHHGLIGNSHVRTPGWNNPPPLSRIVSHRSGWTCLGGDSQCSLGDLTNFKKPGFVFSINCDNADFACAYFWDAVCIGSEYIFLDESRGVGFIGMTRWGWVYKTYREKENFLSYLFDPQGSNDDRKVGPSKVFMTQNLSFGGSSYIFDHEINFILFGSPEQLIWSDIPQHLEVAVDYDDDAVFVTSSGNPIEGASVCFSYQDLSRYYVGETDADGIARIDGSYEFDVNEETNITVTKHNYIPYQIIGAGELEMDMTTWRGDIAFYNHIEVPGGKHLVIKPGTTIRAGAGAELRISGDLVIEGDDSHHVLLTSVSQDPQAGDWGGIRVSASGSFGMNYCDIEYASSGIIADNSSIITATNSSIKNWDLYGIQCFNVYIVNIDACAFEYCGSLKAIDVINGNPAISGNDFKYPKYGIYYQGDGSPVIHSNSVSGNSTSQFGITVTRYGAGDTPTPTITNNNCGAFNYGLVMFYCPDDPSVIVKGNTFNNHRFAGLVLSHDTPILGGSYASGEFNEFSDNDKWGISIGGGSATIRENAIKRNGYDGIRAYLSANPDVGTAQCWGFNSIWGYQYDGYNTTTNTIQAVGNYWNSTAIPVLYGDWDASNPLGSDPHHQAKPESQMAELPKEFKLHLNYPNPFNANTIVSFDLPKHQDVHIEIFNLLGQKVRVLADAAFEPGTHSIAWDGRDENGNAVGSGIYFYTFISDEYSDSKKMTLIK